MPKCYQDPERFMLQFGTHFCMHQFFALAVSQYFRQTSLHDFFCAEAGADANKKPSAVITTKIFMLFLPGGNTTAISMRLNATPLP
jgi:hypothetical protein